MLTDGRGDGVEELISVVVPVGGVDDPLAEQLRALVGQETERPYEVVLALNSSDAGTRRALEEIVAGLGDPRVRVVDATDRRGAAHARNVGARHARGGLLVFCDADDVAQPGWLEGMVSALAEHDAVGGRLVDFGLSGRQAAMRPPATPDTLPTFLGVPYIVSASLALSRDLFDEVGGFDEELVRGEDIALSWRLLDADRTLGFAPDATIHYRHRPGLPGFLKQHYLYGQGMAQVLARYGVPGEAEPTTGLAALRPNGQTGGRGSWVVVVRRGALASGRLVGLVKERVRPCPRP
jgi:GT2 family glycosyltransferase